MGSAGSGGGRHTTRSPDSASARDRNRWRGPLGFGLGISALVHFVGLVLYSFSGAPGSTEVAFATPDDPSATPSGTEIVNLVAVEGEAAAPIEPDPEVETVESTEAEPAPIESDPGPDIAQELLERLRTAGEVLRPHAEDSIILREVNTALTELTDEEQAQLRMNWMVNEWNQLEDAERRRAEEALDWTYTDDEGKRWGVSPGKLHLGALTLPLPALGQAEGVDPAADRMRRDLAEIDDQAARGLVWQNWQRRAAEIRKRKDRERAERLEGQRVDTTGVRR